MNKIKITIQIELLKFKDGIRHIDKSAAAGHISQDDAHCLKNGLVGVYAAHIADLVEERIRPPCRICAVARATGDDGLCGGCRGHRILKAVNANKEMTK
jgi:hypothetical protein